jgi:hypothetical protein
MKTLCLLLLLPLGACSYTNYLSGADENGGTVNLVTPMTEDAALASAKEHCHKYGRVARIGHNDQASNTMTFTCEIPDEVPAARPQP